MRRQEIPIFQTELNSTDINVLFDTGAELNAIESRLGLSLIKSGVLTPTGMSTTINSTVGKTSCAVYKLSELSIGPFVIHNLPVVLADTRKFKVSLILSAYVFKNNTFILSYANNELIIDDERVKDIYAKAWENKQENKISVSIFANSSELGE